MKHRLFRSGVLGDAELPCFPLLFALSPLLLTSSGLRGAGYVGSPGEFPISESAYPLLQERVETNRNAFFVYRDADAAANHGYPSGLFGTTSKIHIDAACLDDPDSTTGCSTNLDLLDQQRGNVLRLTFDSFAAGQFAGVNFEEPERWGVLLKGLGYDLTGATQVVASLRSPTPGGITVQFGVGGFVSAYVHIPQSSNYTTRSFELNIPASSLTNVNILFAVATDVIHAPNGGTLLLDEVRFEPVPVRQTGILGFPLGNETYGVVPRVAPAAGREPIPLDQLLRNLSTVYESALTLLALLDRGTETDLACAGVLADTFVYALNHDNHGDPLPATNDWAGLHSGYMSGDIALRNGQGTGAGQPGDIRLAGFSCGGMSPTGFCVLLDGATGGNNAFVVLALAAACKVFGDQVYLEAARTIGRWVVHFLADQTGSGYGGYFLGYPDRGEPKVLIQSKSVENNADLFAALTALAELERQLGNQTAAEMWDEHAYRAGDFVMELFDPVAGRFWAGTVTNGTLAAPGIRPDGEQRGSDVINTFDFLDANVFSLLALAESPRYRDRIDWRRPVRYVADHFVQGVAAAGQPYFGFSLLEYPTAGPAGVAWEFTGQAVLAMKFADHLYGESAFSEAAAFYLGQIRQAQVSAPFGDGRGLVASVLENGGALAPIEQCLSTPFQCIPERVGLAATAWAIFAERGCNPLRPELAFRFTDIEVGGSQVILRFTTLAGRSYRVERSDNLTDWVLWKDAIPGTGQLVEVVDWESSALGRRFYRVGQNQPAN
jgi:hypothetical protein